MKTVRVCGPRYWPQVIELIPEDKPWWFSGDRSDPFSGGILYIKRKVGACSYVDDPVGCQSMLSRAIHKVVDILKFAFYHNTLKTLKLQVSDLSCVRASTSSVNGISEPGAFKVDQLVSTFSSDPSLIAFAQLCCDPSWDSRSDVDFQGFCLQVLFDCVSKDKPALLQVNLALYTTIGSMGEQVVRGTDVFEDALFISSLK
ncbi:Anaphase-promoting complex subunit, partial [Thalictrum thalictroides]